MKRKGFIYLILSICFVLAYGLINTNMISENNYISASHLGTENDDSEEDPEKEQEEDQEEEGEEALENIMEEENDDD